jgi:hypothetical protein
MQNESRVQMPITTRRPRKTTPKTRTGCVTCKIRRVKCDEGKPHCLRCIKFGISCDGYKAIQSQTPAPRSLQPALFCQPHIGPCFKTGEEYRYFEIFKTDAIPLLGGVFSSHLWERLIPQASENERFVLDAVIAIGALTRTTKCHDADQTLTQFGTGQALSIATRHTPTNDYEYAVRQYSKALREMQATLSDGRDLLRKTLLACLLVFCFETFCGNQTTALLHAQSGIDFLRQWQPNEHRSAMAGVQSPEPSLIEDELVQALARLDLQIVTVMDMRPLELHRSFKEDCFKAIKNMPCVFTTIDEARKWCELLMRLNLHFKAESLAVGNSQGIASLSSKIEMEDALQYPMGSSSLHEPQFMPSALLPEYATYVTQLKRWEAAFDPFFAYLQASNHGDLVGATLCLLHVKMSEIFLASSFSTLELSYDKFLPQFRQIVDLTESIYDKIVSGNQGHLVYHFDFGIVAPLFLTATKCRERAVRRKAIKLLRAAPLREGVSDSICCGLMGEWTMCQEELGIETGIIPEHRRLKIKTSNIDLPGRKAHMRCTQRKSADAEELEWKEAVLTW